MNGLITHFFRPYTFVAFCWIICVCTYNFVTGTVMW